MNEEKLRKYEENEGELIAVVGDQKVRLCEGRLVCGNYAVAPEFWPLSHVPWDLFVTLRFKEYSLTQSSSEIPRRKFSQKFMKRLNGTMHRRHPDNPAKKSPFKYIRMNETGHGDDEIHCHLLLHRDQRVDQRVTEDAFNYLNGLPVDTFEGLESKNVQMVKGQTALVSYFCKLEHNRTHKEFFAPERFMRIIRRKFPCSPIRLGGYVNLGLLNVE